MSNNRVIGTVKWFNNSKGYGFLAQENGEDIFVHYSSIQGSGYLSLQEGQRVEFSITQARRASRRQKLLCCNRTSIST